MFQVFLRIKSESLSSLPTKVVFNIIATDNFNQWTNSEEESNSGNLFLKYFLNL